MEINLNTIKSLVTQVAAMDVDANGQYNTINSDSEKNILSSLLSNYKLNTQQKDLIDHYIKGEPIESSKNIPNTERAVYTLDEEFFPTVLRKLGATYDKIIYDKNGEWVQDTYYNNKFHKVAEERIDRDNKTYSIELLDYPDEYLWNAESLWYEQKGDTLNKQALTATYRINDHEERQQLLSIEHTDAYGVCINHSDATYDENGDLSEITRKYFNVNGKLKYSQVITFEDGKPIYGDIFNANGKVVKNKPSIECKLGSIEYFLCCHKKYSKK